MIVSLKCLGNNDKVNKFCFSFESLKIIKIFYLIILYILYMCVCVEIIY